MRSGPNRTHIRRPKLRDVFHQLLFALACFDMTFIVCGGVNYTFRAFKAQSDVFTYLFPYLIYPMTHVAIGGTIMMTVGKQTNKQPELPWAQIVRK